MSCFPVKRWVLFVVLLACALVLPRASRADGGPLPTPVDLPFPQGRDDIGFDQKLGAQLPLDAEFRDETGQTVKLGSYFGKRPVIMVLAYYECPMMCTMVLNGLTGALRAVDFTPSKDFEIVTISINPRETPQLARIKKENQVKSYRRPEAAQGWHFLTGAEAPIQAVAQTMGFRYAYDPASNQYAHASGIVIATSEGKLARYFYGNEFSPKDIRLGLIEAAQNKIGNLVDQVMLLCYRYNAHEGRYTTSVLRVLRTFGVVTVIGICLFWAKLSRRERKRQNSSEEPS